MKNRKKILFFLMSAVGGAERMTVNIAKMLPLEKFDVSMVVIGRSFDILEFIPSSIPVKKLSSNKSGSLIYKIWRLIIQEKPDMVFASSVAVSPRVIIASRLSKTKVIIRSSGMVGYYKKSNFLKVKYTYPLATLLIAQQEDMRQEISKMLRISLNKIVTLNNPLDLDTIDKKKKEPSPYTKDGCLHYVNVSRIHRVKGHDIAIKALAEARKKVPHAHLYFVGKYNRSDKYYQQLTELVSY